MEVALFEAAKVVLSSFLVVPRECQLALAVELAIFEEPVVRGTILSHQTS